MAQTFDTSRVGGGTYELEQDSSGNYKLKSVGFAQVNKLNLPDLATSDTPQAKILPVEDKKKIEVADPFKKLAAQNTGGGEGGGGQDYSGVMLKTPEVKDVSVRNVGDAMTKDAQSTRQNFDQSVKDLQDKSTIEMNEAQIAKLNAEGASPQIMAQAQARLDKAKANEYDMYRTGVSGKPTGNFYQDAITRGQVGVKAGSITPERTTGLQKVTSKAKAATTKVANVIKMAASAMLPGAGLVISALQAITPKTTATQQVNKDHFNVRDDGRIAGNPATDLYAGMNRTSDFGNLEKAGNKRVATREATIARREKSGKPMSDKFKSDTANMKKQAASYKQAKETATDTSPGATGGEGGSSGSDSGRVICTDLHRTGELSTKDWIRDTKFTFKTLSKTHVKGYLLWAEPTVKHMQKYPRYRKMWKHIAQHRANDIAWRLNEGKFDLLGRIYAGIGEPVCWAIGNFVSDKQISKYNLTHWRRA